MDDKTLGSWLVHHTSKLSHVEDYGKFDKIRIAGKSAVLLSALSQDKDSSLTNDKVKALAKAANINPTFELSKILEVLDEHKLIDKGQRGIDVLGLTTSTILEHASNIFNSELPEPHEKAVISLSEICSQAPIESKDAAKYLSDSFRLSASDTTELLISAEDIGFTDYGEVDETVKYYFNGNLFRKDSLTKIGHVLNSLAPNDQMHVKEVEGILLKNGCIIYDELERILGTSLAKKLISIGMYDLNEVSNPRDRAIFVTRPAAFVKYGNAAVSDAFDLAKALVASITYGINRSTRSRGKIRMVDALLNKLIAGDWVGPASAIGEDYKVLETKNVIEVTRDRYAFSMKLLKKEVGVLARQVIIKGDASEEFLPQFPGASITKYTAPEEKRGIIRKKLKSMSEREMSEILSSIRTGRSLR